MASLNITAKPIVRIATINSFVLPSDCGIRRDAVRPIELQDPTYHEKYDALTVLFDLLDCGDETLFAVSPPFLNFKDELFIKGAPMSSYFDGKGITTHHWELLQFTHFDRSLLTDGRLIFTDADGNLLCESAPSLAPRESTEFFKGMNMLHTLQKDEPLEWIVDWFTFHHRVHGANALSLYDNGSTTYTLDELTSALETIDGLEKAMITPWSFPYGPQGGEWSGLDAPWDSNFTQEGAIEHARVSLFKHARGVLNLDVDEYLVPQTDESVFDALDDKETGLLLFNGQWMENVRSRDAKGHLPHAYEFHHCIPHNFSESKWGMAPERIPFDTVRTTTHWLIRELPERRWYETKPDPRFIFGHFKGLTTGWKNPDRLAETDLDGLQVNLPILAAMRKAFGNDCASPEQLSSLLIEADKSLHELECNYSRELEQANLSARFDSLRLDLVSSFASSVSQHPWSKHFIWDENMVAWETKSLLPSPVVFCFIVKPKPISLQFYAFVRKASMVNQLEALLEKTDVEPLKPLTSRPGFFIHIAKKIPDEEAFHENCQECFAMINRILKETRDEVKLELSKAKSTIKSQKSTIAIQDRVITELVVKHEALESMDKQGSAPIRRKI